MREETGTRNAVNMRACIAAAYARAGDVATAVAMGTPVLDELEHIASGRTLRALEPVRNTDDPIADHFRAQFATLESKTRKTIT